MSLDDLQKQHQRLQQQLSHPDAYRLDNYKQLNQTFKKLSQQLELELQLLDLNQQLESATELQQNSEMKSLAEAEINELQQQIASLKTKLQALDPEANQTHNNHKNCILEIRAGVGGNEAALFAGDLYRMYMRFCEKHNLKTELLSYHESDLGGFKEIICLIQGQNAYQLLQFESGVHRVQRIPSTESQGRVHTSTISVAIMPEVTETELVIEAQDLRIDTYRSSGHGGQSVNTTDSAVRITHLPTGIISTCQDEKSQFKNKDKALKVLRARLQKINQEKSMKALDNQRQQQIGRAGRMEKIRTYNFNQDRLTDHRLELNFNNLNSLLNGNLDKLIQKLKEHQQNS